MQSTVYDRTIGRFGKSLLNQTVIPTGTIITIKATRCDGVIECGDGSDEKNGCGMKVENTILAGKTLLTYIFCQDFLFYTVNNYRQVTGVPTGENFAFSYTGTAQKLYRQVL